MKTYKSYKVTLTTLEPFRIGSSKDVMSAFDNPVAMIGGRVVVQGPTFKGFMRSRIEEYLIDKYSDAERMKPCIPSSANTLSADEKLLINAGKYRQGGACQYSPEDDKKRANKKRPDSICPACYFLGSMGLNGFVRVPYLYAAKTPEELYSVRLDRAKDTVVDKTNRDYQIMADQIVFEGTIEVMTGNTITEWNLGRIRKIQDADKFDGWLFETSKKYNKKFVEMTHDEIIEEFLLGSILGENIIGGFRSKGCGKVKIEAKPKVD